MNKSNELKRIAKEIEECKICKEEKTGISVPGEGSPDAKVVFIGEAPGRLESQIGRPFVGRSGKYLRAQILSSGLNEKDVFITSPVKYLPIHKTPKPYEIAHGRLHLNDQLRVIDPRIIVLLGSVAAQAVLEEKPLLTKDHGKIVEKDGKTYLLFYHPAFIIRFPKYKDEFEKDFTALKEFINN